MSPIHKDYLKAPTCATRYIAIECLIPSLCFIEQCCPNLACA